MRSETLLLKTALKHKFPQGNFKVYYRKTANPIDHSDTILILTDISYEDMRQFLLAITKGIEIIPQGATATKGSGKTEQEIQGFTTDIEFIEIGSFFYS